MSMENIIKKFNDLIIVKKFNNLTHKQKIIIYGVTFCVFVFLVLFILSATGVLPDWFGLRKQRELTDFEKKIIEMFTDDIMINYNVEIDENSLKQLDNNNYEGEIYLYSVVNNIAIKMAEIFRENNITLERARERIYIKIFSTKSEKFAKRENYQTSASGLNQKNFINIQVFIDTKIKPYNENLTLTEFQKQLKSMILRHGSDFIRNTNSKIIIKELNNRTTFFKVSILTRADLLKSLPTDTSPNLILETENLKLLRDDKDSGIKLLSKAEFKRIMGQIESYKSKKYGRTSIDFNKKLIKPKTPIITDPIYNVINNNMDGYSILIRGTSQNLESNLTVRLLESKLQFNLEQLTSQYKLWFKNNFTIVSTEYADKLHTWSQIFGKNSNNDSTINLNMNLYKQELTNRNKTKEWFINNFILLSGGDWDSIFGFNTDDSTSLPLELVSDDESITTANITVSMTKTGSYVELPYNWPNSIIINKNIINNQTNVTNLTNQGFIPQGSDPGNTETTPPTHFKENGTWKLYNQDNWNANIEKKAIQAFAWNGGTNPIPNSNAFILANPENFVKPNRISYNYVKIPYDGQDFILEYKFKDSKIYTSMHEMALAPITVMGNNNIPVKYFFNSNISLQLSDLVDKTIQIDDNTTQDIVLNINGQPSNDITIRNKITIKGTSGTPDIVYNINKGTELTNTTPNPYMYININNIYQFMVNRSYVNSYGSSIIDAKTGNWNILSSNLTPKTYYFVVDVISEDLQVSKFSDVKEITILPAKPVLRPVITSITADIVSGTANQNGTVSLYQYKLPADPPDVTTINPLTINKLILNNPGIEQLSYDNSGTPTNQLTIGNSSNPENWQTPSKVIFNSVKIKSIDELVDKWESKYVDYRNLFQSESTTRPLPVSSVRLPNKILKFQIVEIDGTEVDNLVFPASGYVITNSITLNIDEYDRTFMVKTVDKTSVVAIYKNGNNYSVSDVFTKQ